MVFFYQSVIFQQRYHQCIWHSFWNIHLPWVYHYFWFGIHVKLQGMFRVTDGNGCGCALVDMSETDQKDIMFITSFLFLELFQVWLLMWILTLILGTSKYVTIIPFLFCGVVDLTIVTWVVDILDQNITIIPPTPPHSIPLFWNVGIPELVLWSLADSEISIQISWYCCLITFQDSLEINHWLSLTYFSVILTPPPLPHQPLLAIFTWIMWSNFSYRTAGIYSLFT